MRVSCPRCGTTYEVTPPAPVSISCAGCHQPFDVAEAQAKPARHAPRSYAAPASAGAGATALACGLLALGIPASVYLATRSGTIKPGEDAGWMAFGGYILLPFLLSVMAISFGFASKNGAGKAGIVLGFLCATLMVVGGAVYVITGRPPLQPRTTEKVWATCPACGLRCTIKQANEKCSNCKVTLKPD